MQVVSFKLSEHALKLGQFSKNMSLSYVNQVKVSVQVRVSYELSEYDLKLGMSSQVSQFKVSLKVK